MKKITIPFLISLSLIFVALFMAADSRTDYQAIKKAVKENLAYDQGKEVKWFKILVTDNRTNKEKVRITIPLSLVEVFARSAENKNLKIRDHHCELDLAELIAELKKIGPMALIEIYEEDETVKVWLE